jgi:hypothetical protein
LFIPTVPTSPVEAISNPNKGSDPNNLLYENLGALHPTTFTPRASGSQLIGVHFPPKVS